MITKIKPLISIVLLASSLTVHASSAYLRSSVGAPWGASNNEASMDGVFGTGNWSDLRYETVNTANLFSANNNFIYMEGGDSNADELETFITNNKSTMETWVSNGGRLLLNSAPNEGNGMDFGFGVSLNYSDLSSSVVAVDASHEIFNGPFGSTGAAFTGSYFAHATVSGQNLTDLIVDSSHGRSVLSEMIFGNGLALFGGMTTLNFQNPNSFELRQNIINYAANSQVSAVPVPAAVWLFGSGLAGLIGASRKKKQALAAA